MNALEKYISRLMEKETAKKRVEEDSNKVIIVETNEFDNIFGDQNVKEQTGATMFDNILVVL